MQLINPVTIYDHTGNNIVHIFHLTLKLFKTFVLWLHICTLKNCKSTGPVSSGGQVCARWAAPTCPCRGPPSAFIPCTTAWWNLSCTPARALWQCCYGVGQGHLQERPGSRGEPLLPANAQGHRAPDPRTPRVNQGILRQQVDTVPRLLPANVPAGVQPQTGARTAGQAQDSDQVPGAPAARG